MLTKPITVYMEAEEVQKDPMKVECTNQGQEAQLPISLSAIRSNIIQEFEKREAEFRSFQEEVLNP